MASLDRVLREIAQMGAEELRAVRAALERRARELGASTIVERRGFREGVLQLEYRLAKGVLRGPYWYFRYRRADVRRVLYLGRTDDPEALVAAKLDAADPETKSPSRAGDRG